MPYLQYQIKRLEEKKEEMMKKQIFDERSSTKG